MMPTYYVTKVIAVDAADQMDADELAERIISAGFEMLEDSVCDICGYLIHAEYCEDY